MIDFRCGARTKFYRRCSRAGLVDMPPPAMPYCPIRGRRFSNFQEGAAASPINATEPASWCRQLRKEPHGDRPGGFFFAGGTRPDLGFALRHFSPKRLRTAG
jgi:hypothetical protein